MCIYIYIYTYRDGERERERDVGLHQARRGWRSLAYSILCHIVPYRRHTMLYTIITSYYIILYHIVLLCFIDSASLPFKFLNWLPGGCSGGEGTPPETLKCLTHIPYS